MPQGVGIDYKITVCSGDWKAFFTYVIRMAFIKDLERIGGQSFSDQQVEIWNPANPRGDIMPNMVFEFLDDGILVTDFGGHGGELMEKLRNVFATWRRRYVRYDLRMDAL